MASNQIPSDALHESHELLQNYHKCFEYLVLSRAVGESVADSSQRFVLGCGVGIVRRLTLMSIDVFFVALATIIAVVLRGYFDSVSGSLVNLMPYSLISLGCASVVFLVGGLERTPWRYSSVADHLQVIVLTVLAILLALVLTFALNRLEPVARSLPVLQGGLIITLLIVARCAARFWHTRQIHINGNGRVNEQPHETVLVVGVNTRS